MTAANTAQIRRIRLKIGMIFQQFNLVKRSSVMTNVLTGGWATRATAVICCSTASHQEDYTLAMRNLERVGIPQKATARADQLIGRAAAARGHRPRADAGARADAGRRARGHRWTRRPRTR